MVHGIGALGWRAATPWQHYEMAYLSSRALDALVLRFTPSCPSTSPRPSPRWHTTIFPPICRGAIFGGSRWCSRSCSRALFSADQRHDDAEPVDKMAKIILMTGSIVGYAT